MNEPLRRVPQLDRLLLAAGDYSGLPRAIAVRLAREFLDLLRQTARTGGEVAEFSSLAAEFQLELAKVARCRLQPVINATGVILHTNLGRAPISPVAAEVLRNIAASYSNVEIDLESGERGHRGRFLEVALATLCQAESATVVNNCAAALVLTLRSLTCADRCEVVISRGQLIEIGGGFRIPDILETSGAVLREVGTTNRTTLEDYARAISSRTALVLQVHRSNFSMSGFVAEPSTGELAALAHQHGLPLVADLGSGAVEELEGLPGLTHEPLAADWLAAGADLVCLSGDKLFGGPQAGILLGSSERIARVKCDPFFRALRCDKLILTVLQETTLGHFAESAGEELPVRSLLHVPVEELRDRAVRVVDSLAGLPLGVSLEESVSRCGGGTQPDSALPTFVVSLEPSSDDTAAALARRLRMSQPPVISRIEAGAVLLDVRTIWPSQESALVKAVRLAAVPESSG